MSRSPEQLLRLFEKATVNKPLNLKGDEGENFIKAMKSSQRNTDIKKGFIKSHTQIVDKDILLRSGVKSQADGKYYSNRREYNDHLKRYDMVEIGDQAPIKAPKEIRGDFECRKELHEAFKQHLG